MQVRDLDGNTNNWSFAKNSSVSNSFNKSSLHLLARQIIKEIFPTMQSLEEVTVHIRKNQIAYLDFFIPLVKLCIEVHGEQHYKFTPFYHANALAFAKAKKRPRKKEWCEINNIKYIELPFNKTEEWAQYVKNS
jgi:hypothetical protein